MLIDPGYTSAKSELHVIYILYTNVVHVHVLVLLHVYIRNWISRMCLFTFTSPWPDPSTCIQ